MLFLPIQKLRVILGLILLLTMKANLGRQVVMPESMARSREPLKAWYYRQHPDQLAVFLNVSIFILGYIWNCHPRRSNSSNPTPDSTANPSSFPRNPDTSSYAPSHAKARHAHSSPRPSRQPEAHRGESTSWERASSLLRRLPSRGSGGGHLLLPAYAGGQRQHHLVRSRYRWQDLL
jgi:hypothetical protein